MEGEIRVARSRILAAAEEERRRLERDLHDGAQQRLIALRVKLGLIGEVDRAEARRVVAELAEDVDATLDELRSLAQGIYPPLLRTEGLVGALNAAARRSSLPTAVHTAGLGRYTAEVESAVYFCCLEALQNAGKHAGPDASATISVSAARGSLRFEVEDTGVGFDPSRRGAGIGIANIDERMLAVGGHMHVISQPGCGTTLSGRVPLVRRAATTLSG
jgi:signal transduction histidine kinase